MPVELTQRDLNRLSSALNLLADPIARSEPLFDKVIALGRVEKRADDVIITIDDKCPAAILDNNVLQLQKQLADQHGLNVPTVADVRALKTDPSFAIISAGAILRIHGETTIGTAQGEMAVFKRSVFMAGTQTMVAYPGAYGNQQGRFDAGTPLQHGLRELNEELVVALRHKGDSQVSTIALLSYGGETGVTLSEKADIVAGLRAHQIKTTSTSPIPEAPHYAQLMVTQDPDSVSRAFNVRTIINGKEMPSFRAGVYFETKGNTVEIAPVFNLRLNDGQVAEFFSCEPYGRPVKLVTPSQLASEQDRFDKTPAAARTPEFLEQVTGGILCTLEPAVRGRSVDIGALSANQDFDMPTAVRQMAMKPI